MVAFIHEGVHVCANINVLKTSIQKLIKSMKKPLERVWEDIVNLLEDEFPLPIQTPAIPSV